jgi:hypothetical protein
VICPYCLCDPEKDTLHEALLKIKGCINCRADISLKGDWTGHGWAAIKALIGTHGKEKTAKAAKALGL